MPPPKVAEVPSFRILTLILIIQKKLQYVNIQNSDKEQLNKRFIYVFYLLKIAHFTEFDHKLYKSSSIFDTMSVFGITQESYRPSQSNILTPFFKKAL